MKNFSVKIDGKEYWISRSVAVAVFLFAKGKDGNLYVLANKRGSGTPDFQGCWNCPCGYLDFDETFEEAGIREVFEETGYKIPKGSLCIVNISDDPTENRQNIVVKLFAFLREMPVCTTPEGGEENEVDFIKWIKVTDIDLYRWAFNHEKIIEELLTCGAR